MNNFEQLFFVGAFDNIFQDIFPTMKLLGQIGS